MIHHIQKAGAIVLMGLSLGEMPSIARDREEQTNIDVYARASGAVVSLRSAAGIGSGTIVSPEGWILTSAHVVRGQTRIEVTLANGQRVWGKAIAANRTVDLALLQLEGLQVPLPALEFAALAEVKVGQRAFAIGNPFGRFAGTLTTGIVSRIDRTQNLIQTDAAIAPGNSGGPLLDSQGRIIGINTAVFVGTGQRGGIGFAIAPTPPNNLRSRPGGAHRSGNRPRTWPQPAPAQRSPPHRSIYLCRQPLARRQLFSSVSFGGATGAAPRPRPGKRRNRPLPGFVRPSGSKNCRRRQQRHR
ncbi:MAG: trypsin-like serine protease [Oscillatoriales cyanobacterium SM2_1_8]|nr:trypsin-like serine protease [Oscillatoriales cyanobacterium SM2_1_8]